MSKFISKNTYALIFSLFVLIHLLLLNINSAEWGDSYRILRASEYIRHFSYPDNEKRPPLYSIMLSVRSRGAEAVTAGRVFMIVLSICYFYVFSKYSKKYIKGNFYYLSLLLLMFNPVLLYWSIRIMSDVFFGFIVLLCFYLYDKYINRPSPYKLFALGLLSSLAVMTRFEGFILIFALSTSLALNSLNSLKYKEILLIFKKNIKQTVIYCAGILVLLCPYLYVRNPLNSSYFEEPSQRTYNFNTLIVFIVSLFFLFGFTHAFYFIFKEYKTFQSFLVNNGAILIYVSLEMFLILLWPAAIPRLFVPAIPFLVIILVKCMSEFYNNNTAITRLQFILLFSLPIIYALSLYKFKLQFLVPVKFPFYLIFILQLLIILFIYMKKTNWYLFVIVLSSIVWSLSVIKLHKDIFKVIKNASVYAAGTLNGTVGYNDVSSVAEWYLNNSGKKVVKGVFYPYNKKSDLDLVKLKDSNLDYLMITNEHNTDMSLDISSRPYLKLVKSINEKLGGKTFFTVILKINKD